MSNMRRSTGLKFILLLALVLSAANCGDDSEIIIVDLSCPALDGFQGGAFLFTVDSVSDDPQGCSFGQGDEFVGEQFGPIDLPGTEELPAQRVIEDVPLVGDVTVNVTTDGETIRVEGTEPIDVLVPGLGNITATVSGILCPTSADQVDGQVTVRITNPFTCNVRVQANGVPQ